MSEFNLRPIHKEETTKERVYRQIKEAILKGDITDNQFFTETQLADSLNISRTPVREALQNLMKESLIVSTPRKGFKVKTITPKEQEEILLLRKSIETKTIEQLARQITEEQLAYFKELRAKQIKAMKANDNLTFIEIDQEFHLSIVRFIGYQLIEEILLNLHELTRLIGLKAIKKYGRMDEVIEEHRKIISALEQGEATLAANLMYEHLTATGESLDEIIAE
ncbi:GntR family transcriptional regulator [Alkalihalobacterium alkalinitrilicum]|uniref:GntR family transcriptional regulator n=1 Tax=Alkalihalobacterium alkalinitrilicum TaxID=427920 RepID=UPI000995545C|nr:GntR family transcriptional regulator [Alkalihalobacterium alkalinitrilicum]